MIPVCLPCERGDHQHCADWDGHGLRLTFNCDCTHPPFEGKTSDQWESRL